MRNSGKLRRIPKRFLCDWHMRHRCESCGRCSMPTTRRTGRNLLLCLFIASGWESEGGHRRRAAAAAAAASTCHRCYSRRILHFSCERQWTREAYARVNRIRICGSVGIGACSCCSFVAGCSRCSYTKKRYNASWCAAYSAASTSGRCCCAVLF